MFNNIKIREFQQQDAEMVWELCSRVMERTPQFPVIYAVVAKEDDKIVGFSAISENLMIEPLAVNNNISHLKYVWIKVQLLNNIRNRIKELNINKVMFSSNDNKLIKFLNKRFNIQEYTKEPLYIVNL